MKQSRLWYKVLENRVDFDASNISPWVTQGIGHWTCEEEI